MHPIYLNTIGLLGKSSSDNHVSVIYAKQRSSQHCFIRRFVLISPILENSQMLFAMFTIVSNNHREN